MDSPTPSPHAVAARLGHLARHGTLKDFSATIREKTALLKEAQARGLVEWDQPRQKLSVTALGHQHRADASRSGFTLIELSIVLVIIGLVAGGVLVGREMIYAARIRATISQVEQFQTA